MHHDIFRAMLVAAVLVCSMVVPVSAKSLQAPPGMFKDLNDEIVGNAIIIHGKQLFIDDYIIEKIEGAEKILNQPIKHPGNPILVKDKPWEVSHPNGYASVIYDKEEKIYKLWY
ncbi:MAG: hypothetical protein QF577_10585, partial [Phycisphaerae bacterium]|nr:hypothetical protein [Phycisphaerae bacterium]